MMIYIHEFVSFTGYTIPKGWKVLVWFRSIHLDPQIYENPREFDPSRWDVSLMRLLIFLYIKLIFKQNLLIN